jgi:hypothetical protein
MALLKQVDLILVPVIGEYRVIVMFVYVSRSVLRMVLHLGLQSVFNTPITAEGKTRLSFLPMDIFGYVLEILMMTCINQLIERLGVVSSHFCSLKIMAQADYALQAGSARTATFADRAQQATQATQADKAQEAQHAKQSDYTNIAKQAERLILGGDNVYIDSTSHYVIFYNQGADPAKSIILDIGNRSLFNVDQISNSEGVTYALTSDIPEPSSGGFLGGLFGSGNPDAKFSSYRPNPLEPKVKALENRISQLEARVSAFTVS